MSPPKVNESCAPFNTSQFKVSCFDNGKGENTGPGYYEPKYHKDIRK